MMPDSVAPFIAARDLLLRVRTDYEAAVREFRWPVMDRFNWAVEYFDHLPADDLALWCVGTVEEKLSFGALRARSNQVANYLRELGGPPRRTGNGLAAQYPATVGSAARTDETGRRYQPSDNL